MSTISNSDRKFSIHQLLLMVRDAYIALIPTLNKATIPWQEGLAYDDWDRIGESIYDSLVINMIYNSLECRNSQKVLKYGFSHNDYSGASFISLISQHNGIKSPVAFVRFKTIDSSFDYIHCNAIDDRLYTYENRTIDLPIDALESATVSCRFLDGNRNYVNEITLDE